MTADRVPGECCDLCGRDLPENRVESDGRVFCCTGCRDVHRGLGDRDEPNAAERGVGRDGADLDGDDVRVRVGDDATTGPTTRPNDGGPASDPDDDGASSDLDDDGASSDLDDDGASSDPDDNEGGTTIGHRRTFLRVDGMHCATCEAFLEAVAQARDGVADAEASYVTETVRVDHDPNRTSKSALRDALSTTGYTAYLRDDATDPDHASAGPTRRSREMGGIRKRRTDDMLDARYVAGVVFTAFLLIPYVTVLYPAYLSEFYAGGALALFQDTFEGGGLFFFRIYFVLTGVVLVFTGMPLLRGAYVSLKMRRPNTDLLVALAIGSAYVYSTIAALVGRTDIYYDFTMVIAAVVMAATVYESTTKRRAVERLTELTVSQVDTARLYHSNGTTTEVSTDELATGDRVLVRRGERVPVDGVLDEGTCTVDEAVVTGESLPSVKRAGDDVVGGSVVTDDAAVVRVDGRATSSIDRLTSAVWNLQSADHGVQRRADGIAAVSAILVLAGAILAGGISLAAGRGATDAALATLLVVVVSSPWALGLATPLSVAASIRTALERGIVVFDETVFERLRAIDVVVFDKTGTLTTGRMEVIEADAPNDLLGAVAALERRASHPAADAIVARFGPESSGDGTSADGPGSDGATPADTEASEERPPASDTASEGRPSASDGANEDGTIETDGSATDAPESGSRDRVTDFRNHATGVRGTVDGRELLVGHPDLFDERGWTVDEEIRARAADARSAGRLPVVVGADGEANGVVVVGDEPRDGWDEPVTRLHDRGIETVVLTGDDRAATDPFDRHPAVDRVFDGVPPEGKTATVRRLRASARVAMVGDGTNDAPAIAEADLGISVGSGTALAADAADVAILDDDLDAVETAFDLSRAVRRRVDQNVALAFLYSGVTIPIAVAGLLNPLVTAVATVATSLLIAANAGRSLLDD